MSPSNSPDQEQSERQRAALSATFEMDAIARHLNGELPMEQPEYQHLRSLVVRIQQLNSVVMSVLGDDTDRSARELCTVVEGC